jgi:hypothetical protein
MCVIGVTHTTREGHGGDGGEVQKIVATWNARQAGSVCFLSQRRTGSRITVITGATGAGNKALERLQSFAEKDLLPSWRKVLWQLS